MLRSEIAFKLILVIATTVAGSFFSIWRKGIAGSLISGFTLLLISSSLAFLGEKPLWQEPLIAQLILAVGIGFGLLFPCCAPQKEVNKVQIIAGTVVFLHSLLDGHVLREATSLSLILLLGLHKFQDGMDGRLASSDNKRTQLIARLAILLATPLGFFLIPESSVPELLHSSLLAFIIGLNLGSAYHLFKHAWHLFRDSSSTVSIHPLKI